MNLFIFYNTLRDFGGVTKECILCNLCVKRINDRILKETRSITVIKEGTLCVAYVQHTLQFPYDVIICNVFLNDSFVILQDVMAKCAILQTLTTNNL